MAFGFLFTGPTPIQRSKRQPEGDALNGFGETTSAAA
jgi:hypothetical protein